jgi:hypothetical protein
VAGVGAAPALGFNAVGEAWREGLGVQDCVVSRTTSKSSPECDGAFNFSSATNT